MKCGVIAFIHPLSHSRAHETDDTHTHTLATFKQANKSPNVRHSKRKKTEREREKEREKEIRETKKQCVKTQQ